jgi:catechol 2,3-dioxygenase-like lactoylglutathione lyase family enzyme
MNMLIQGASLHHTGRIVTDIDEVVSFMTGVLGYRVEFSVRNMADQYQRIVGFGGIDCDLFQLSKTGESELIELIEVHGDISSAPSCAPIHPGDSHWAYVVADLHDAIARIKQEGGELLGEVVSFEEGPAAYMALPGNIILEIEGR